MNEKRKQCFDFDSSFIEPNWDLSNCCVEKNKTYPLEFTEEELDNIEDALNEKQVLSALGDLTNGALNYYKATQTVMVRDNLIRNYITNLQKQNTELKEENEKIKETIQEYNDAGEYIYKLEDNWNKLKEWLEEEYKRCDKIGNPAVGCAMGQIKRTKNKMQEIEGGRNEYSREI